MHCNMNVRVHERKDVIVKLYLLPRVSNDHGTPTMARLHITAEVREGLISRLRENGGDCWILVEAEVRDEGAGRRIGYIKCVPRAVDVDSDGQLNYDQGLVACNEINRVGRSKSVILVLKVIFITCQRKLFEYQSHDEDNFLFVDI